MVRKYGGKSQAQRIRENIARENPFIPRCRNCGRVLRAPESIRMGFGLVCGAQFGVLYVKEHPLHLGERAKKVWTPKEIKRLTGYLKEVVQ